MWFGIVFAVLVEIVPLHFRSTVVGIFLFVMNNIGGNLPILVDPVAKAIGYRESVAIFYAGFYALSTLLFFVTMFFMEPPKEDDEPEAENNVEATKPNGGIENTTFVDEHGTPMPSMNNIQVPNHKIIEVRPIEISRL